MLRYVSFVVSDSLVGFISYWPAWFVMAALFVWFRIASWKVTLIRVNTDGDISAFNKARRRSIIPAAILVLYFIACVVFIMLSRRNIIDFSWQMLIDLGGVIGAVARFAMYYGPTVICAVWCVISLAIMLSSQNDAYRRAARISMIVSAIVGLLLALLSIGAQGILNDLIEFYNTHNIWGVPNE